LPEEILEHEAGEGEPGKASQMGSEAFVVAREAAEAAGLRAAKSVVVLWRLRSWVNRAECLLGVVR